jgi:histidyl-tRNA synthetase
VKRHLTAFDVPFRENPRIVRGLDYYSHTAFEFVTDRLGAQGTVMGGGRYNGLVEEMGGPPTPCVGWAAGVERLSLLLEAGGLSPAAPRPVAVVPVGEAAEAPALDLLALAGGRYSRTAQSVLAFVVVALLLAILRRTLWN